MIADNESVPVTKSTFKEALARDGVLVYRSAACPWSLCCGRVATL